MARGKSRNSSSNNSADVGFEARLWLAADKVRSNMDAAKYKLSPHGVTGFVLANGSILSNQSGEVPSNRLNI
jgi:hypothetical protein